MRIAIVGFLLCLGDHQQDDRRGIDGCPPEGVRVRRIVVIANEDSSLPSILKSLSFEPGQVVGVTSLSEAEKRLESLKLFVVDPVKGIRPRVSFFVIGADGGDVLVRVQEIASLRMFPKGQQHDFGTITGLPMAECSFQMFNPTSEPVKYSVRRTAGIYKCWFTKAVLQPMEEGELRIVWDTRRFVGRRVSTIYVDADTSHRKNAYMFTLMANVRSSEN